MQFSRVLSFEGVATPRKQRRSTRLSFFSLGFTTAAWAPLIPYAQQRLHLNHADFGLLLLCMGIGSMLAMPLTGKWVKNVGCRVIIAFASMMMMTVLPTLTLWNSTFVMAFALFLFGASAGSFGVAINLQAIIIEKNSLRALMSGFHGMCSLGGLLGVLIMTALLSMGLAPLLAAMIITTLLLLMSIFAVPPCLSVNDSNEQASSSLQDQEKAQRFHPIILMIGLMCFIAFLSEGSAMDWGGIYLTSQFNIDAKFAGLAYTFFALSMTIGRFSGRKILKMLGEKRIVTYSAFTAGLGLCVVIIAPYWWVVLLGYALLGFGCSNIVPVMFSRIGRQNLMAKATAMSSVSTMAYTGSLTGPALIGIVGQYTTLSFVFTVVAVLLVLIALLNQFTQVDPVKAK
ncbi:MAG: MFS transporter [Acinetobacter sp.]